MWGMVGVSKKKLYDDDIYVAPYTKRRGKYRYVSGHYRRSRNRNREASPSSSDDAGCMLWLIMFMFPPLMWIVVLPSCVRNGEWGFCALILIYSLIYFAAFT